MEQSRPISLQKIQLTRKSLFSTLGINPELVRAYSSAVVIKFDTPVMRGADSGKRGVNSSRRNSCYVSGGKRNPGLTLSKNCSELPLTELKAREVTTPRFIKHSISEKKVSFKQVSSPVKTRPLALKHSLSTPAIIDDKKERMKRALCFLRQYACVRSKEKRPPRKSTFASQKNLAEAIFGNVPIAQSENNSPIKEPAPLSSFYTEVCGYQKSGEFMAKDSVSSALTSAEVSPVVKIRLKVSSFHSRNIHENKRHSLAPSSSANFLESLEKLAMTPLPKND